MKMKKDNKAYKVKEQIMHKKMAKAIQKQAIQTMAQAKTIQEPQTTQAKKIT